MEDIPKPKPQEQPAAIVRPAEALPTEVIVQRAKSVIGSPSFVQDTWDDAKLERRNQELGSKIQTAKFDNNGVLLPGTGLSLQELLEYNSNLARIQATRLMAEAKGKPSQEQRRNILASQLTVTALEQLGYAMDTYLKLYDLVQELKKDGLTPDFGEEEPALKHLLAVQNVSQRRVLFAAQRPENPSLKQAQELQAQQNVLDRELANLLACQPGVPGGNKDGIPPVYRLLLSMLQQDYKRLASRYENNNKTSPEQMQARMEQGKKALQEAFPNKKPEEISKDEADAVLKKIPGYDLSKYQTDISNLRDVGVQRKELKEKMDRNMTRLADLNRRMGDHQIGRLRLATIRHHFDQGYNLENARSPGKINVGDIEFANNEKWTEDQKIGSFSAISQHLNKVDENVLKIGLPEKAETIWNEHGRVFASWLADKIATLETCWVPDIPGIGDKARTTMKDHIMGSIYDAVEWPRYPDGRPKDSKDITPEEWKALKAKQDSIEKAINRFKESKSLERVRGTLSVVDVLLSRKDLKTENFLEAGEIDLKTLPKEQLTTKNLDQMIQKYGAPTVYKMAFVQLQEDWDHYSSNYEALLHAFSDVVGKHYDMATAFDGFGNAQFNIMWILLALTAAAGLEVGSRFKATRTVLRGGRFVVSKTVGGTLRLGLSTAKQFGFSAESSILRSMNGTEAIARQAEVMSKAARVNMAEGALKLFGGGFDAAKLGAAERQALQNAIWNAHQVPKTGPNGTWALGDLRAKMRILTAEGKLTQAQARMLIEAGYCGPCSANTIAANLRAAGFPQIAEETTTIARMFSAAETAKNTAPAGANTVRSSARALEVGGEEGARVAKTLSPEAKSGLQALENTGKGLRWGRVVPVAVVALDAFIVYDSYNNLNNAKEYVQKLQDELKDMLPKSGFNKVEEGVYERDGVMVRVTDLTKLTEQQVAIARQRLQSNVAVGVAGLAVLCADTGIGIPLGLALAAGAATIEINHSVNERSKMVSFIENADPWILAYMGTSPLTKVKEQDFLVTELFKWGVTDLFINKSPEFQRKVAFSMFMSHLKSNPSMLAEIVGTDFSPKSINEFYNTDFKNLVYPSMTAFLFTGMKDSTAPWTDIREFRLQAGSLDRQYAVETDVKRAMGDATLFYLQHLREKRYLFYRRSLEQCFLESQRLAANADPADKHKAAVLMEQAEVLDLILKSLGGQIVFGKMLSEVDSELETSGDATRAERYLVKLRSKIEGSLKNGVRAESFYEYVDQPHTHVPGARGQKQIDQPLFGGQARATRPVYPKIGYRVSGRDLGDANSRSLPELVIGDRQNLWDMAYGGIQSIRKLEGERTGNLQRFAEKFPMNVRSVFVRECNMLSEKELDTLDVNLIQGMYHDDAENLQKFLCTVGPSAIKGFIVLFANLPRQDSFNAVRSINALSNEQCARFFAYVQEYLPYRSEDRLRHVLSCLETATVDNFRTSRQDDVFATRSVLSVLQARKAAEDFRQKMEEGYEKDRVELLAMTQLDNWRGLKPLGDSRNKEGPFMEMRVVDRMADAKNPIFEFAYAGDVIDQSFLGTNAQIPRSVAVSPATLSNGINPPLQKNFVVTQFDGQTGKKIGTFSIDWQFRSSKTLTDAEKLMRMRVLTSPTGSESRMEPLQRILDLFPHQVTHQQRVVEGKTYNDFTKPSTLYFVELQKKLEPLYRSSENRREFLEDLFLQLEAAGGITEQSVKTIPEFLEKKQQKQREEKQQKRLEDCMQSFNGYESAEDATNAILRIEEKDGKKFWVIDYTPSDAAMAPFMEKGLSKCFDGQYLPRLVSIDFSNQRNIRLRLEDIPPASGKEYWPSGEFQGLKRNFKKFEQGEFAERIPGKELELMLHRGILSILNDEGAGIKLDPSKASSADIAKAIAQLRLPWLSTENDQLVVDGKVVVRGWTSLLQQKPNEALDMLANVYVPIGKEKPSEQMRKFETMQWRLRNLFSMSGLYLHPNIGEGNELNYRQNQERPERVVPDIQNDLNGFGLNGSVRVPPSSKVEVGGKELLVGRSLEVGKILYSRSKDYIMISAIQGGPISLTVDGKEFTKK